MADVPIHAPLPQRPSPRQVVLGLFVVAQLGFLVSTNLLGFYQDAQSHMPDDVAAVIERVAPGYSKKAGHAWLLPDEMSTTLRRWTQLTGQDQRWSLFAPSVYKVTGFPALVFVAENDSISPPALARTLTLLNDRPRLNVPMEDRLQILRSTDLDPPLTATSALELAVLAAALQDADTWPVPVDVDLFHSDNEPVDRQHYARLGMFRIRRFESYQILYLTQRDNETLADARERWADSIRDHVGKNPDSLLFYLKWRLAAYQSRHPDRPAPKQVILIERVFPIQPPSDTPGDRWLGPRTLPIVRWQPGVEPPQDYRPIERYNPVTERFENVLK
jgi:hypothetical protein